MRAWGSRERKGTSENTSPTHKERAMAIWKTLAILALTTILAPPARAQVERVELDIAGYLCGF